MKEKKNTAPNLGGKRQLSGYVPRRVRIYVQSITTSLRTSLWFRPTVYSLVGVILAVLMVFAPLPISFLTALPSLQQSTLEEIMKALSSSALTVATVSLSVLMIVLNMAGSDGSPRALPELMSDKTVQKALGAFIGIFVFSFFALVCAGMVDLDPSRRTLMAIAGVSAAVMLLRWFVTLVTYGAELVKLEKLIERLHVAAGPSLASYLETRPAAESSGLMEATPLALGTPVYPVEAGYFVAADIDALIACSEHGLVIEVPHFPGSYVSNLRPVLYVKGLPKEDDERRRELEDQLHDAVIIISERDGTRDPLFNIDLLCEIAARALSPGVNDPVTATSCVDRLGDLIAPLIRVSREDWPSTSYGQGRVKVARPDPIDFAERALVPIARHGADNLVVITAVMTTLDMLTAQTDRAWLPRLMDLVDQCKAYAENDLPTDKDKASLSIMVEAIRATAETSGDQEARNNLQPVDL